MSLPRQSRWTRKCETVELGRKGLFDTVSFPSNDHCDWKTLYRAAILETNKSVIPQRVLKAEQAVLARGRDLFYDGGTHDEQESLEDALYALRRL